MIIARSHAELQNAIQTFKNTGQTIGFAPTMGALHDGHLSLVKLAKDNADIATVSIFVNPTQFGPNEDFETYPRQIDEDLEKLKAAGAELIYLPRVEDIYPNGETITVKAGEAAKGLEADFRPTHFDGVATVVHTLLTQVQPDVAIFGEKDFQQLQVIREMVINENLPVRIIGAPIARDAHGLALSSRNAYLSIGQLEISRMLNQIIYMAAHEIREGTDERQALETAKQSILTTGFDKVDYVESWQGRVLAAAWLGKTRLIDNAPI
ncbi:MAG: pantoate--beta-alanine ligase [Micavibrio sp.]|nr:pantoate--beta-alanine ligase [Micavibrio sp.]